LPYKGVCAVAGANPFMESEVGAEQDFMAAVEFNGVLALSFEEGVGYCRDEPAKKRQEMESA
jgi:hypothetical protein